MPKPIKYTHSKVVKITETQLAEKLQREKIEIVKPKIKDICPF